MRTQVTVARLRDIKLHAFRDRTGDKHVTGMTIYGALVIPTRLFWIALAEIGGVDDAKFGNEYETYKKCIRAIGDHELYFEVTVDEDGSALLDGVNESADSIGHPGSQFALVRSRVAARRGAFYASPEQTAFEPLFAEDVDFSFDRGPTSVQGEGERGSDSGDWPLLCTPHEPCRDLWGWKDFCRLPADGKATLLNGPAGTPKPSLN